ncbi:MAG TPA: TonB-dependent receptor plug domain-containing protein, partial [Allosphingosinicella sp.]
MDPFLLVAALQVPGAIVVTGSREPVAQAEAAASVTTIEERALKVLDLPQGADALRLLPGVSVSVSGPRGTQTQLRIRGAEANHSLLFIDGIRFNDPAAGNEARFELLNTDLLSHIELIPGPQSALWGPEALGGVVSVETADPFARRGFAALAEYGGQDSVRGSAQAAVRRGELGLSANASWLSGDGIDSFGGAGGDRDGFDNRSLGLRVALRPGPGVELGVTGLHVAGTSEYDGFDPVTFRRADTRDETENRI